MNVRLSDLQFNTLIVNKWNAMNDSWDSLYRLMFISDVPQCQAAFVFDIITLIQGTC